MGFFVKIPDLQVLSKHLMNYKHAEISYIYKIIGMVVDNRIGKKQDIKCKIVNPVHLATVYLFQNRLISVHITAQTRS